MFMTNFIDNANKIHNSKYDYSLVNYVNANTKIKIICKTHGVFEQLPRTHINNKAGCKKCADIARGSNKKYIKSKNILNQFKDIHGYKYDYSEFVYNGNDKPAIIICKLHGKFHQLPSNHLKGKGCKKCALANNGLNQRLSYNDFVYKSNIVHNHIYDYSKFIYTGFGVKSTIICSKHGEFLQTPRTHLNASGCKICNNTSKGEMTIYKYLTNKNIPFVKEKTFPDCKLKNVLRFDFYVPHLNMCIEYDGIQHFRQSKSTKFKSNLKYIENNDQIKNKYCINNNIKLIRIKYNQLKNIYSILDTIFIQHIE